VLLDAVVLEPPLLALMIGLASTVRFLGQLQSACRVQPSTAITMLPAQTPIRSQFCFMPRNTLFPIPAMTANGP
jgi:hypothetical protein